MCRVLRPNLRLGQLPKAEVASASHALRILGEMKQVVIEADQISLNSAISASSALWLQSLQLLWSMPQLPLPRDVRSFSMPKLMPWVMTIQLLVTMDQVLIPPNEITFSSMLRRWPSALDLLTAAVRRAVQLDRVALESAIRSCGQRWFCTQGLLVLMQDQRISANRMTYNSILNSLKGHWQIAMNILEALPSMEIQPDAVSYSLGSDEWPWATALLQAMTSKSLRVDALGLRQAAMSGPWPLALELLELSEDSEVTQLATYASALLWQQALAVAGFQVLGLNFLLKSMDAGHWQSAGHVLLHMASCQVQANLVSYNTFLSTLSSWQQTLAWLQHFASHDVGQLDVVTFSSVISCCADAQQWTWAFYLLHCMAMTQLQLNLVVYNAAMASSVSRWRHSVEVLHHMGQQLLRPDVVSTNTVLKSLSTDGPWQLAGLLVSAFPGRQDSTGLTLCSMASSRGHWSRALGWLGGAHGHAAMSAYEGLGRWRQTLQLFPKETTVVSFNTSISACEKGGAWGNSLQLLQMMSHMRVLPDVIGLSSAISASEKRQQWRVAINLLEAMALAEVVPNAISYNSVMRAVQWDGSMALSLFYNMVDKRLHNLISSNCAVLACEQGSCHKLATVLLNNDLPRLSFQMMAARSECQG